MTVELPSPAAPLSRVELLVFGPTKRHPITGFPIELGSGALPIAQQAQLHCSLIDEEAGKAAGDTMRKKLADALRYATDAQAAARELKIIVAEGITAAAACET